MASLMSGRVGIDTVLFTREEVSSILAATTRSRPRGSSATTVALAMRGSPAGPGQLALDEKAKAEFLLGTEGPRGRWRRGICVAPEGLNFFPSTIFTCVLLSQISLLLLRVTVKFGFAPFCFDQYATACEQGQSAETCYAS